MNGPVIDENMLTLTPPKSGKALRLGSVRLYAKIGSTMTVADRLIKTSPSPETLDGTLFIARQQTAGRGSGKRHWASPLGNAYVTLILKIQAQEYGQEMEIIAAAASAEVARELLPDIVSIKYPNDIRLKMDDKDVKVGGCLVSPFYDRDDVRGTDRMISVGIGFNLSVAPPLPGGRPTTCLADHGVRLSVGNFVEKWTGKFNEMLSDYRACKDFNIILNRIGFLDNDGLMVLRTSGSGQEASGHYAGFRVVAGKTYLRFADGMLYDVHAHRIYGMPTNVSRPAFGQVSVSTRGISNATYG